MMMYSGLTVWVYCIILMHVSDTVSLFVIWNSLLSSDTVYFLTICHGSKCKVIITSKASNGKISSSGTDQADHADQTGQVQIKRDKCRSSGSCMRKIDQTDQIIYYNLWMTKSVQNYRSYIKTIKITPRYLNKYLKCYRIGRNACKCFIRYLYFFYFLFRWSRFSWEN